MNPSRQTTSSSKSSAGVFTPATTRRRSPGSATSSAAWACVWLVTGWLVLAAGVTSTGAQPPRAVAAVADGLEELYQRYVTGDGVRYAAWQANAGDRRKLGQAAQFYAATRAPADRNESLAWHLNAYNVWVLELIMRVYPVDGPLAADEEFFERRSITVTGRQMSLNELEHGMIRPRFKEPRIHFAVNCAAASCPPLHPQPFAGATLDRTLDRLTRDFVNRHPHGVRSQRGGSVVALSKIFEWYAEDFGGEQALVNYVNQYRDQALAAGAEVTFLDYDWRLNAAR